MALARGFVNRHDVSKCATRINPDPPSHCVSLTNDLPFNIWHEVQGMQVSLGSRAENSLGARDLVPLREVKLPLTIQRNSI